ncbi:MAG: hypothetical protein ACLQVD_07740 [Capsulimonadaceae bacterium]
MVREIACVYAIIAVLAAILFAAPSHAAVLTDTFEDYSKMDSHTGNWRIVTDNPQYFQGAQSRLVRTDAEAASICYHLTNIRDYRVFLHNYGLNEPPVLVELSPDGTHWTPQPSGDTGNGFDSSGPSTSPSTEITFNLTRAGVPNIPLFWSRIVVPKSALPQGANYLRLTVGPGVSGVNADGPFIWTPQLSQITITYNADNAGLVVPGNSESDAPAGVVEIPSPVAREQPATPPARVRPSVDVSSMSIPGGLTALAASDSAAIQWLPIQSADHYVIERSDDEGATFKPINSVTTSDYCVDTGLKAEQEYRYKLVGLTSDGTPLGKEIVSVTPIRGAVMMTDPFDDWGQADSHTDNLQLTRFDGLDNCVERTTADAGSVVYNLPGTVVFAFTTFFSGDLAGQVSVDCSPDGQTWEPVRLVNTPPVPYGAGGHFASVWAPARSLPGNSNYIRIHLVGLPGSMASPALAFVRVAYGATGRPGPQLAANSTQPAAGISSSSVQPSAASITSSAAQPGAGGVTVGSGPPGVAGIPSTPAQPGVAGVTWTADQPGAVDASAPPARAGVVFEDTLTDWSRTASHSDTVALDGECDGRKCIQCHSTTAGSVTYNVPGAEKFAFDMYYAETANQVLVESSTDGSVWMSVVVDMTDPVPATGDRPLHVTVTPKASLSTGTCYLRITFIGVNGVEISGIKIYSG